MGMAASQARFLGLTARKNNIEFEGQQINQQRTVLANQSANYYNDLLGMSVPVPPSVDDFTKTVYTFVDGALQNQITAMIAQNNGLYTVSYLRQWDDDFSVVSAATSVVNVQNGEYHIGADKLRKLQTSDGINVVNTGSYMFNGVELHVVGAPIETEYEQTGETYTCTTYTDGTNVFYLAKMSDGEEAWYQENASDPDQLDLMEGSVPVMHAGSGSYPVDPSDKYLSSLSDEQLEKLMLEEKAYLELLQKKYGEGDYMVRYILNTSTGDYEPYFYSKAQLDSAVASTNGDVLSGIKCYTIGSETKTEEVKAVEGCRVEKDSTGRYINITIPQVDRDGNIDASKPPVTYALTTSTVTDQERYDDAMNQYEYDKYQYDQTIQEINAKIEIVQAQDKSLELRLKQLDTEQKAVSTEMESVDKVIKANVEKTFNVFS